MALWEKLKFWSRPARPEHLLRGSLGERAARDFLSAQGMKFLTANFASRRGEIDLVFRDENCLVFVEVKTRSEGGWTRPARAVDDRKKKALARTASDYLRMLEDSQVVYRFDVVEVLLKDGKVSDVRHLRNSFNRAMIRHRQVRSR
jgi:putative endonuclease